MRHEAENEHSVRNDRPLAKSIFLWRYVYLPKKELLLGQTYKKYLHT